MVFVLFSSRKGKGKQRAGAASKGGIVKVGVPKFHVIITHYEVISSFVWNIVYKSDWHPKGLVGSTDAARSLLVHISDLRLLAFILFKIPCRAKFGLLKK